MKPEPAQSKLVSLNLAQERDLSAQEMKAAIAQLEAEVAEIKTEVKSWSSWLLLVAGTIIVTTWFAVIVIAIPLGFVLWKQI